MPRHKIWECLEGRNVPRGLIQKIRMIYKKCESCVQVGNGNSEWFETRCGVQQGNSLSTMLFMILMDEIIKRVKRRRGEDIDALVFADDVMIWGETEEEVQEKLDEWNEMFTEFSLRISQSKTVVLNVNRRGTEAEIVLNGERLQNVEQFKHLGSFVTGDNSSQREVTNRTEKASQFYNQVRNLLWDSKVPHRAKLTLFKIYYIPILTEMNFIRSILGRTKRDRIRNETNRKDAGVKMSVLEIVSRSRVRWYGHVRRMNNRRKAKQYFEKVVVGKRPVGRPRKKWIEQVKKDVTERGQDWDKIHDEELYKDRKKWRALVNHTRATGVGT